MIALKLEGRLGNQLFQYAFIYTAAKKLNTSFYLDKSIERFLLPQYFAVTNDFLAILDDNVFSIPGYKNIFRIHLKRIFYNFLNALLVGGNLVSISNDGNARDAFKQLKNNTLYLGFFQSENYFNDFEEEVRTLFKVKKEYACEFEQLNQLFGGRKKKAVIHVRRTDYVGLDLSLPVGYYKNAIEKFAGPDIAYIFITDDQSFVEKEFSYIPDKYISTQSEIIDLQFLINADFCVLSNSSFSWWGAWLNNNQHKKVYAPKYWLGFKEKKYMPSGISDNIDFNWIEA